MFFQNLYKVLCYKIFVLSFDFFYFYFDIIENTIS